MSSPSDYSDDIRQGVYDGMPDWGMILDSIHEGISQQPVPLPPGSHLELEEGERGVDVVALRNVPSAPDRAEVLTERGYWVRLNDKQCLAIDHKPRTEVAPPGGAGNACQQSRECVVARIQLGARRAQGYVRRTSRRNDH